MSENEQVFETWEEVINDFFKRKKDLEEEKYLKEKIKEIGKIYADQDYFKNEKIEFIFDSKKNKKAKDQSPLNFQQLRAIEILKLEETPEELNLFSQMRLYVKHDKSQAQKFNPNTWLTDNSKNASSVSFATHVAKLTHSKIDTPSVLDSVNAQKDSYLTTSSLKEKKIDGAVAGNQFAPIFQFLELEFEGKKLAEQLVDDDSLLEYFLLKNEGEKERLEQWNQGLRKALDSGSPATHNLAKQVYFPVENKRNHDGKGEYHLLSNMISSSLAHTFFERIFDDSQKPVKKTIENNKYSNNARIKYLQRSHLSVTASNHSNASQLNGKRAGKLHLFSSQPPTWQSQLKPPINRISLFDDIYNSAIKTELEYLRDFLLRFKQLDLSIKDPKRKRHLIRWVDNIIDECLFYIASIQNQPAGWSAVENIRLKPAHQYLLDPYRLDDDFQASRQNTDWQSVVCADFAQWINRQLRGKDKQFTPQAGHTRLWKKLLEKPLREHMEMIEQEIKQALKEVV
jgi:CRISPR-associated protein Csy1